MDKDAKQKKDTAAETAGAMLLLCLIAAAVVWYYWSDIRAAVDPAFAQQVAAVRAVQLRKANEKAALDKWQNRLYGALVNCKDAVRRRSKFPTRAKFSRDIRDVMQQRSYAPTAKIVSLSGRVELMNGFGAMIPHQYTCVLDVPNWRFTSISVTPG